MTTVPHIGEVKCLHCGNRASYYHTRYPTKFCCGVHLRPCAERRTLPEWTEAEQCERALVHIHSTIARAQLASTTQAWERITLHKMRMMHGVEREAGILNVLPNFRSRSTWHDLHTFLLKRGDAPAPGDCDFRCSELSPKWIGPIVHGQPGLPPARNLENFHQGSKCFADETDEDFAKRRIEMYNDPEPHRHKWEKYPSLTPPKKTRESIRYFEWITPAGEKTKLSYIQSRQLYCNFYERMVGATPAFAALVAIARAGFSMRICGFDADPIPPSASLTESLARAYEDESAPFGHERVLYSMILAAMGAIEHEALPWITHKTLAF